MAKSTDYLKSVSSIKWLEASYIQDTNNAYTEITVSHYKLIDNPLAPFDRIAKDCGVEVYIKYRKKLRDKSQSYLYTVSSV
jgi:hypothetical protein